MENKFFNNSILTFETNFYYDILFMCSSSKRQSLVSRSHHIHSKINSTIEIYNI